MLKSINNVKKTVLSSFEVQTQIEILAHYGNFAVEAFFLQKKVRMSTQLFLVS